MANAPIAYEDTIDSISTNTLTVATAPPTLPTYGHRFVWFVDGAAAHEVRKITSRTATTVTVDDLPAGVAINDTIRISDTLDDYAGSIAGLTGTSSIEFTCTEDIVFVDGSFLAMWGQSLIFTNTYHYNVSGTADQQWQMGYRNPEGFIEGGCKFSMVGTNDDRLSVNTGGGQSGVQIKWFGSQVYWRGDTSGRDDVFAYFLNFNDVDTKPQIEGCDFFISGGFRIGGTKGVMKDNVFYSVTSQSIYPITTKGVLAEFDNNQVVDGRQAFYWAQNSSFGGSTTIRGHGAVNVTFDLRFATGSGGQILTSIDDTLSDSLSIDGSFSGSNSVDRYVGLRSIIRDLDGNGVDGAVVRNLNTDQGQIVKATTASDGTITEQLVWRQRRNSGGDTNYYNNVAVFRKFGKVFGRKIWDSRTPLTDVEFQDDQSGVTQNEATAQAHTGISISEGTFNLFGGTFSIKVTCNLTTNPSLDIEDVYNYLQYWLATNSTFTGSSEDGTYWHELIQFVGGSYVTTRSEEEYGAFQGVCVVDENDNAFPGVTQMTEDDGTVYIPPTTVTVSVTVVDTSGSPIPGARVYLEAGSGGPATQGDVLLNGLSDGSGVVQDAGFSYSGDQPLQNGRARRGTTSPLYKQGTISGAITSGGFSATVTLVSDE